MLEPSSSVLLTVEAGVAILTLNRPDLLNAIDVEMAETFLARIEEIAGRDDVRAILIKGAGRGFCAGGDVSQFTKGGDPAAAIRAIIDPLHAALLLLDGLKQPSIACLHGAVAGGGFSLALACDLAIAAENTKLTLAYARIGATPDASGSYRLVRALGMRKAKELALLADTIDAAEALRLGLVNRVVPVDMLEAAAMEPARRLDRGLWPDQGPARRLRRPDLGRAARCRARDLPGLDPDRRFPRGDHGIPRQASTPLHRCVTPSSPAAALTSRRGRSTRSCSAPLSARG